MNKKLYVVVKTLKISEHYLINTDFILYSNHESLKTLNIQKKISTDMMARWITSFKSSVLV
jgi:hypothetical protein